MTEETTITLSYDRTNFVEVMAAAKQAMADLEKFSAEVKLGDHSVYDTPISEFILQEVNKKLGILVGKGIVKRIYITCNDYFNKPEVLYIGHLASSNWAKQYGKGIGPKCLKVISKILAYYDIKPGSTPPDWKPPT